MGYGTVEEKETVKETTQNIKIIKTVGHEKITDEEDQEKGITEKLA